MEVKESFASTIPSVWYGENYNWILADIRPKPSSTRGFRFYARLALTYKAGIWMVLYAQRLLDFQVPPEFRG